MFAVVRSGGKQYRVAPDDVIRVERLKAEAGEAIELGEVLAMSDGDTVSLGQPLVEGARVAATVVEHTRGDKIIVFRQEAAEEPSAQARASAGTHRASHRRDSGGRAKTEDTP